MSLIYKAPLSALAIALVLGIPSSAPAQRPKPCRETPSASLPGVSLSLVAKGLSRPTHIENAGDGSNRLFVVEQPGTIRIVKDGKVLREPFLDIRRRVRWGGEMGLLSMAFHPRFGRNGRFFLNYTSGAGGLHTVVSEFKVSEDPDRADPESERILLTIEQPYPNHNGGQNAFGPDGYLYIGMGDGGSGDDPRNNGQRLGTLLGKMLRIDIDSRESDRPYKIPPDNPFANGGGLPEIYAWGLRNPWRFSFDPVTKLLYAGDVGQDHWEEIDIVRKGGNYGWRVMEGSHCTPGVDPDCKTQGLEPPIHDYGRGEGISVTGGFVYRGREIPGLCGAYVFGDYGSGRIWALRYDKAARKVSARGRINSSGLSISSFGIDEGFEIYAADYGRGRILKLSPKE